MSSERTRSAPPRATALVESLRGLGYTAGSALADVIDNSIAAGASAVWVDIEWNDGNGRVTILDDGRGMDDASLESAMRLGDRSPLEDRDATDLGRFGLGLKTASFSQGRRLTVASKKDGIRSVLRWDLNYLLNSKDGGWYLLEGADPASEGILERLDDLESGTLVIWEVLDRMLPKGGTVQDLLDLSDRIAQHLAMVFHRFLADGRLSLMLNREPVKPWNPFLVHTATWSSPDTPLPKAGKGARVQAFVLPHKDYLKASEYQVAGGPEGWNAHQGFFVYRNDRLLLAGGWLGLGRGRGWNREEPYQLARIRLDIPNSADADWKIDIRKSTAQPPPSIREELAHIARDARDRARNVFAYRGRSSGGQGAREAVSQTWETRKSRAGTSYRISREHPAVAAVLDAADKSGNGMRADVLAMLRVIEETVPVQRIWLDTAEDKETPRTGFGGEPPKEVMSVARTLFSSMVKRKGMAPELARANLLRTEPFDQYPELIAALTEGN